jgi:CarD family transcriptional regulator
MTFAVGAGVVYPGHGAGMVEGIETRAIKGEDRTYLVLRFARSGMVVHLPTCNVDLIGVRQIIDDEGLERVLVTLRADGPEDSLEWSLRYRANAAKLRGGEAFMVAEVVRDLWRRDRARGLAAAERSMLAEARQILVSEMALCANTDEEVAKTFLEAVLAG